MRSATVVPHTYVCLCSRRLIAEIPGKSYCESVSLSHHLSLCMANQLIMPRGFVMATQ